MCLIVLAWQQHPHWPLLLVAHRDEFRDRPTAALSWWTDLPILAGRDLRAGGSWLGVNRRGQFAALTNVRRMPAQEAGQSRGIWVPRALTETAAELEGSLRSHSSETGAFNLLHGDCDALQVFHSPSQSAQRVPPGVHGLSNAALNTDWPKVRESRSRMAAALVSMRGGELDEALLWSVTAHAQVEPAAELPDTGIGQEWERRLAPPLILGAGYGTVSRTVLALGVSGEVRLVEQQLDSHGQVLTQIREQFVANRKS